MNDYIDQLATLYRGEEPGHVIWELIGHLREYQRRAEAAESRAVELVACGIAWGINDTQSRSEQPRHPAEFYNQALAIASAVLGKQ